MLVWQVTLHYWNGRVGFKRNRNYTKVESFGQVSHCYVVKVQTNEKAH